MAATIDKNSILTEANLRAAFSAFDLVNLKIKNSNAQDKNGVITADELNAVFGKSKRFSPSICSRIIKEIAQNQEGGVNYLLITSYLHRFNGKNLKMQCENKENIFLKAASIIN
jgi:hypothetical protein